MDSLLYLGQPNPRLTKLFSRLGYDCLVGDEQARVTELAGKSCVDLILVDSKLDDGAFDLCEFLRNEATTKDIPIIYLAEHAEHRTAFEALKIGKADVVDGAASPGVLASRIATQLRLRKMAGAEGPTASLAEMNAALRDLTKRMQKERDEAKAIQESLLPEALPKDDRFEVAVSYDPLEEVGGDWYYMQARPSKAISFQIADFTGHGLAAAFIGSMTKLALNASPFEDPGELLTSMNRLMSSGMPPGRFVTMASALYDPASGKLDVARAGHPSPLILRAAEKRIDKIGGDSFAVGFFEDSTFTSSSTELGIGDIVLLLTDGITEAQNRAGEMYGSSRLNEKLLSLAGGPPAVDCLRDLLLDFEKFCDGRMLKDDVTVILLRRSK
jgi:serine phosphatase RsbU (regulator of sigma subunit)